MIQDRDLEDQNFEDRSSNHKYRTEIPNILFDMELDPFEMAVYILIKKIAGDNGRCFYSNQKLADMCKMSKSQFIRVKKLLEEKKLIETRRNITDKKSFSTSTISIMDIWPQNYANLGKTYSKKVSEVSDRHYPSVSVTPPLVSTRHTEEEPIYKKNQKNIEEKEIHYSKEKEGTGKEEEKGASPPPPSSAPPNNERTPLPLKANPNFFVSSSRSIQNSQKNKEEIIFSKETQKLLNITGDKKEEWKITFHGIDLDHEISRAEKWIAFHPEKTKSLSSWNSFLEKTWFPRAQEEKNYSKSVQSEREQEVKKSYDILKPYHGAYSKWYESLNDTYLVNLGYLTIEDKVMYDHNNQGYKYKLEPQKFFDLIKNKYKIPNYLLDKMLDHLKKNHPEIEVNL